MSLENSERLWLDEFWSLWQCERSVDLKELEQHDIWTYPQKEAEPTDLRGVRGQGSGNPFDAFIRGNKCGRFYSSLPSASKQIIFFFPNRSVGASNHLTGREFNISFPDP